MMIRIHLTPTDLAEMRFAYSPLVELVTSHRLFSSPPEKQALYRSWVQEAKQALYDVDLPYLSALCGQKSYTPDFLTPTPMTIQLSFEKELEHLLSMSNEIVRDNVQSLVSKSEDSEILHNFVAYPRESLERVAEELRLYWQRTLMHHWSRMKAVLEGDILYRARQQAVHGVEALFKSLHSYMEYRDGVLQVNIKPRDISLELRLRGEGIQLVPTIFTSSKILWQITPEWHPMMIYGARGAGLWRQETLEPDESLEKALGAGRARVLEVLATPSNTGELARKLHITAGAVSQHLSRLNQAGLVEPHRNGKRVYYHLTNRGEQLLNLFERIS